MKRIRVLVQMIKLCLFVFLLMSASIRFHFSPYARKCFNEAQIGMSRWQIHEILIGKDVSCEGDYFQGYPIAPISCEFSDDFFTYRLFLDSEDKLARKHKFWDPKFGPGHPRPGMFRVLWP